MIINNFAKEYCLDCGKENTQDKEICSCGGRRFVYGNNFRFKKGEGITCECGCEHFEIVSHFSMNPIYETTYKCARCGNCIHVQTYYELG